MDYYLPTSVEFKDGDKLGAGFMVTVQMPERCISIAMNGGGQDYNE